MPRTVPCQQRHLDQKHTHPIMSVTLSLWHNDRHTPARPVGPRPAHHMPVQAIASHNTHHHSTCSSPTNSAGAWLACWPPCPALKPPANPGYIDHETQSPSAATSHSRHHITRPNLAFKSLARLPGSRIEPCAAAQPLLGQPGLQHPVRQLTERPFIQACSAMISCSSPV